MGHSLELSDEAAALTHLMLPWVSGLSDEKLYHLHSAHGVADRMLEASLWVVNNTYVSLSDIDYEAFEDAVRWVLHGQYILRSGMSKGDKS